MKTICTLLVALAFVSCNKTNKAFIEQATDADSIAVKYYKGDGSIDSVVAVKVIRDKARIAQLSAFVAESATKDYKCGYDGSLYYFKMGRVIQDVDFRMTDAQCMHFSFILNNNLYSTVLSPEAKQLLETVKQ